MDSYKHEIIFPPFKCRSSSEWKVYIHFGRGVVLRIQSASLSVQHLIAKSDQLPEYEQRERSSK